MDKKTTIAEVIAILRQVNAEQKPAPIAPGTLILEPSSILIP